MHIVYLSLLYCDEGLAFAGVSMKDSNSIENIVPSVMGKMQRSYENIQPPIGIDSGFPDLNTLVGGIQNGLMVVASHPFIGKTALCMGFVLKMAKQGLKGVVFSCDISSELLVQRLISMESNISMEKITGGLLKKNELKVIEDYSKELSHYPITIEDDKMNIDDIVSGVRFMVKSKGVTWIVIDSLGSIESSDLKNSKRNQIADISNKLKSIQRELGIPIIVTLGLKKGKSQSLSIFNGLSEFRSVEKDADIFIILSSQNIRKKTEAGFFLVDAIVTKNEVGREGIVELLINPTVGVFHSKC